MTASVTGMPTTQQWLDAVQEDLNRVEEKMLTASMMGYAKLDGGISTIIRSGGKRMRPAITLLVGQLFGGDESDIISVAASIELLHTATLVHDDLIDGAEQRRGSPTLHSQLPIGITVLTGDFMFAQAAKLAAEANNVDIVNLFAQTLVNICRGEILQAQTRWEIADHDVYIERIYGKTAALFEAASAAGAMLGAQSTATVEAMKAYGRKLGLAFQIVDDALDFMSTSRQLGKPAGHDMRQGIFNLPVMYYVRDNDVDPQAFSEQVQSGDGLDELIQQIRDSGAVQRSLDLAERYVDTALDELASCAQREDIDYLIQLSKNALVRAS